MKAYYNEVDPFASQWLRNLISKGHIAEGLVDHDDIKNIEPADLLGYAQCHFFAGIGVWSHALRKAGWPDNVPVWTGSCPCQPFSSAGRRGGFDDERHLWPTWFELIEAHRPPIIFGEQVASPDGLTWLDAVFADLERADYAVRAVDISAAGCGAPHIRQRLFFVAIADGERRKRLRLQLRAGQSRSLELEAGRSRQAGTLADARSDERGSGRQREALQGQAERRSAQEQPAGRRHANGVGDAKRARLARRPRVAGDDGSQLASAQRAGSPTSGFWKDVEWLACQDGKLRPTQPGLQPLAHGATARVGKLRAYGNAIVAEVATTFIQSVMDVL